MGILRIGIPGIASPEIASPEIGSPGIGSPWVASQPAFFWGGSGESWANKKLIVYASRIPPRPLEAWRLGGFEASRRVEAWNVEITIKGCQK